ncbi:hypothetical protein T06_14683, partial [Trichinella sp. T6]
VEEWNIFSIIPEQNSAATQRHNEPRERFATPPIATLVKERNAPLLMTRHLYRNRYLHSVALETGEDKLTYSEILYEPKKCTVKFH